MIEAPTRDETLFCAQLAGWPEVHLGPVTIGPGEASWREMVGRTTPPDREALAPSLPPVPHWALLAGEGRRRLVAFYARHAGSPPTANDPAALDRTLNYIGDLSIKKVLVRVLTPLPPAVVDLVVSAVWVFGVGRDTGGWFSTAPPLPTLAPDAEALRIIALSGHRNDADMAGLVAHEVAHAWIEPAPRAADVRPPDERLDNVVTLVKLATEWKLPLPEGTFTPEVQAEHRAVALAAVWGFKDDDAQFCARHAVHALMARIQHRLDLGQAARPEDPNVEE